ncbi:hypothetical protein [Bacillus toyonensis]|nr:hypothetical protein [Bacillus toyonensis]
MESNKSPVKESNSVADKGLAPIVANKEKLLRQEQTTLPSC